MKKYIIYLEEGKKPVQVRMEPGLRMESQRYVERNDLRGFSEMVRYALTKLLQEEKEDAQKNK